MGKVTLVQIIGRALTDPEFRERLFAQPEAVAQEYGLSEDEAKRLQEMLNIEALEKEAEAIDRKASHMIYTTTRV